MTDYERRMRYAIRTAYPNCIVYGCWLHYCQAIRKRSFRIAGFIVLLKANLVANKLFHKFLALPLVRVDYIPVAFNQLMAEAGQFVPFRSFIKYFERFWMRTETPNSFCVFLKVARTNNLVESHNSQLRRNMNAKGNFYKFIENIQQDENSKSHEMSQVLDGATQVYPNQRNSMKPRNIKIRKLQNQLSLGELGVEAFLKQVTFFGNNLMDDLASDLPDEMQNSDDELERELEPEPELEPVVQEEPPVNLVLQLDDARAKLNCIICVDRRKTRVLQSCGHMALCGECVAELANTPPFTCPICRTDVTSVITAICC